MTTVYRGERAVRGNPGAVAEALAGMRSSLEIDGYRLTITEATPEALRVVITATDAACAECLAPPAVLKMIISGSLDSEYTVDEVDLVLPEGTAS